MPSLLQPVMSDIDERGELLSDRLLVRRLDGADALTVVLAGELDVSSSPELASLLGLLRDEGEGPLVLELGELTFIDSSGLGVLVLTQQEVEALGRPLILRSPTARVRRLLEVAGLTDHFRIEGDGRSAD